MCVPIHTLFLVVHKDGVNKFQLVNDCHNCKCSIVLFLEHTLLPHPGNSKFETQHTTFRRCLLPKK